MLAVVLALLVAQDLPWTRHTLDASSRGADGVRLADANGDGRPDVVTGWEEGGRVRLAFHPGPEKVRRPWLCVDVGAASDVEDAVLVDLDGDGALEVVSCSEGDTRAMHVHRGPGPWTSAVIPATHGRFRWMFAAPATLEGRRGLFAGGKDSGAEIGWLEIAEDPKDWRWRRLGEVGWVMSIVPRDMDGDGDVDVLLSDRKGPSSGVRWLENPTWTSREVAGKGREAMFLSVADLDGDGRDEVVCAAKPRSVLVARGAGKVWETSELAYPVGTGTAKAVAAGDLDGDGKADLVLSCEQAKGALSGVVALLRRGDGWARQEISGEPGTKFDLVQLVDLDGDGDLDVLTCEEAENLGVVWYENPRL